jgi:Secretion system C-terminal sorting domain
LDVFPNPATNVLYVQFTLMRPTQLHLDFLTVDGQLVRTAFNGIADVGTHSIKVNLADMAAGIYLYRLRSEEGVTVGRVLVVN